MQVGAKDEAVVYAKSLGATIIVENVFLSVNKGSVDKTVLYCFWNSVPTVNGTAQMVRQQKIEEMFRWFSPAKRELGGFYLCAPFNVSNVGLESPTNILYYDKDAVFNDLILEKK